LASIALTHFLHLNLTSTVNVGNAESIPFNNVVQNIGDLVYNSPEILFFNNNNLNNSLLLANFYLIVQQFPAVPVPNDSSGIYAIFVLANGDNTNTWIVGSSLRYNGNFTTDSAILHGVGTIPLSMVTLLPARLTVRLFTTLSGSTYNIAAGSYLRIARVY
jgi:hypothetical protein